MKILMNAGPWLPVPPLGYGGIENVIATLVPELRRLGVQVVLATVGESTLAVDEQLSVFDTGRFELLARPYNQVCGIVPAHLHAVRRRLDQGDIDLVHDHVEAAGLAALGPPRPACTLCTGTWPSTPSCTAPSTAVTGSGSTACRPTAGVAHFSTTLQVPPGVDAARTLPVTAVHQVINRFGAVAVVTTTPLHDPTGVLQPAGPHHRTPPPRPAHPAGIATPPHRPPSLAPW